MAMIGRSSDLLNIHVDFICLQCFDAVGWVAGMASWHGCLSRARYRPAYGVADATVTFFSKSRLFFLVPAHSGSPKSH